jgi:hypothetical protein
MELIPILSLIILVATISTFILSVGAYILYKIRERKGVGSRAPLPSTIPAELVTPAPMTVSQSTTEKVQQQGRRTFEVLQPQQEYGRDYQKHAVYQREEVRGPELRPTFVGNNSPGLSENRYQRSTNEGERTTSGQKYSDKRKFVRYTNEGYSEPSKQEKKQEDNLRWR